MLTGHRLQQPSISMPRPGRSFPIPRITPAHDFSVGGDNLIEIQGERLTVTTSSRNVTPLYWCTDNHGNFVLSTDLLIAASAWANLTDSQPNVREDSGVYLDDRSSIYDIKRLPHSRRLEVALLGDLMHIEQTATKDELALQSNLYDDALLAGQAQISALQQSITTHLQKPGRPPCWFPAVLIPAW